MKVMILGASGQLGSEFRSLENFSESLSLHFYNRQDLDISSKKLVRSFLRNNKFDIIINCAAYTDVDEAENNFNLAKSVNADAIEHFCEYLEKTYPNTVIERKIFLKLSLGNIGYSQHTCSIGTHVESELKCSSGKISLIVGHGSLDSPKTCDWATDNTTLF